MGHVDSLATTSAGARPAAFNVATNPAVAVVLTPLCRRSGLRRCLLRLRIRCYRGASARSPSSGRSLYRECFGTGHSLRTGIRSSRVLLLDGARHHRAAPHTVNLFGEHAARDRAPGTARCRGFQRLPLIYLPLGIVFGVLDFDRRAASSRAITWRLRTTCPSTTRSRAAVGLMLTVNLPATVDSGFSAPTIVRLRSSMVSSTRPILPGDGVSGCGSTAVGLVCYSPRES